MLFSRRLVDGLSGLDMIKEHPKFIVIKIKSHEVIKMGVLTSFKGDDIINKYVNII